MDHKSLIQTVGEYVTQGIAIGAADPDDGAVMAIRWINPAFTDITGFAAGGVLGRTAGVLAGEGADPVIHLRIIRRMQAWESFSEKLKLTRADGHSYWGELTFVCAGSETEARYWILLIQDVSAHVDALAQVSDLSLVAHTSTDFVAVIDTRLQMSWCNAMLKSLKGVGDADNPGLPILDFLEPEGETPQQLVELKELLRAGEAVQQRLIVTDAERQRRMFEADFQPIRDETHEHTDGHVVVLRDISKREFHDSQFRAIFNETDVAIAVMDGTRVLTANPAFSGFVGIPKTVLKQTPIAELHCNFYLSSTVEKASEVLADGLSRTLEIEIPGTQPDDLRRIHSRFFRSFDPLAQTHIACIVSTDVTRIRETEAKLTAAQEEMRRSHTRLWAAIDASPDGLVLFDVDDRVIHSNHAFRDLHGGVADKISPGISYAELVELGAEAGIWEFGDVSSKEWIEAHLADRRNGHLQGAMLPMSDGKWMLCREAALETGERLSMRIDATVVQADKERLRAAQKVAERAESRLTAAIEALDDQLIVFDAEDRMVMTNCNDVIEMVVGPGGDPSGVSFEEVLRTSVYGGYFAEAIGREKEFIAERIRNHRAPGAPIVQKLSDGRVFQVIERRTRSGDTVSFRVDLTKEVRQREALERYAAELKTSHNLLQQRNKALQEAQQALRHSSLHDPLTDLPNRRYLDRELTMRNKKRAEGAPFAVLHVDLDRFKQINDAYGHAVGDGLLEHVSRELQGNISSGDFVARVGGDEFVVLVDGISSISALGDRAQSIINALSVPVKIKNADCRIGASVGIAVSNSLHTSEEEGQILIEADIALYAAKRQGRNRWVVFSPELRAESTRRKHLSDALVEALKHKQIETVYQLQVRATDDTLVGVEALMRWTHPEFGSIDPTVVLSVAEEIGVSAELDQVIFEQIAAHDEEWQAAGILVPKIALNATGLRLRSPQLVEDIRKCRIAPERLTVEVLETIFVDAEDRVLSWNIDQLRELGVSIALDDFGTGHSSIIGLLKLKPHSLKIDKTFVDQALGVREAEMLVGSVIEIGKSLGLVVVAEGIETREQALHLREMGCDLLQGYVFGTPLTAEQTAAAFAVGGRATVPRI